MQWGGLYFMCVAICCLHVASEPLRYPEDYRQNVRRKRAIDEKDGLALSREIFRNLTKQLRENIKREGTTDKADRLLLNKPDDSSRQYTPYQAYHHHEHHWGPYFEEAVGEGAQGASQVTAHVGSEALLNCRVGMLKDKTVVWLRKTIDSAQLLTLGLISHTADNRITMKFQYPNNWRLSLNPVRNTDAGVYMCQISTHPPRTIFANLTVLPPVLTINGDVTHETKDRFYKAGSSIKLSCIISEDFITTLQTVTISSPTTTVSTTQLTSTTTELTTKMSTVFNRIDLVMNKSWSVETTTQTSTVRISSTRKEPKSETTTITPTSTALPVVNNVYGIVWKKNKLDLLQGVKWRNKSATFMVSSASQNDSGTYSCHLQNHSQVLVNVHVLIGENQAAVHHDTWNKGALFWRTPFLIIVTIVSISVVII